MLNQESASSSVESGSSSNNVDGCTSDGDIRRSNRKRKALPAEETSSRKRTKKTETIQDQIDAQRAEFEEKYEEKNQLGKGGCGSVFAGCRREDHLPIIIQPLVDAAVHLKQNSIFHRDIKVENILIETGSDVPRLRLIDFGLSCINKKTSIYRTFYGTSAHVPPEWLSSCTYSAGPTTVWQVGVVLFEMLHNKEFRSTNFIRKNLRISSTLSQVFAEFEEKYEEKNQLGKGGCGSVFAGCRREDNLPVAIKHIPKDKVFCKHKDKNGRQISVEVAVMLKLEGSTASSVGHSAPVSLLDWYDLQQELILVLERPMPAEDLAHYIEEHGGSLQEDEAKIIIQQLVDAAVHLKQNSIFHRDIKVENILIETGSDVPRLRLIDFGMSCINKKTSIYRTFYGTSAHVPPEWLSSCTYSAGPTTVWQVGVVLFEMLHNKEFRSTNFIRKKLKISSTLSQDCLDFLEQCLTKVPKQRPTLEQLLNHTWFT
ncbi:serine/threonine-protein kinase pim-1-like [Leuresthes tenuis]|uniref:serine/threonine-protein kinase pim-1-like n=1 Tax=Leuresthes tenuis TaxID=355514 RepID=UPI003B5109ED